MQPRELSWQRLIAPFAIVVTGLYCIWLIHRSIHPSLPGLNIEPCLYSNQCQLNLRTLTIEAIQQAKKSIHLVMFDLNDPAIVHALERAQNHIPLDIYYDANKSPLLYSQWNAHLHPMYLSGLMHQKIMIVDRELVLIGSANMTTSSLLMHDNLVVGLRSPAVADFLIQQAPPASGYLQSSVGGQDIELWLLPDIQGKALSDLCQYLRGATHSIKVALFTLTHPILCDELIAAKQRGVAVTVVIDLHSGMGASAKAIERLQQHQINVLFSQGIQLLHHKLVWIDDQTLLCGSANWTKAAFEKNSDCIIGFRQITQTQKKFMTNLWKRIETEASQKNSR